MAETSMRTVLDQLLAVLREGVEGPPGRWSYFTDNRADAGLLGTLAAVTAAEASRPLSGTSIAAHAYHAAWAMRRSCDWINGDRSRRDWKESWRVSTVDDAAWEGVLEELRRGYAELRQAMEAHGLSSEESLGGTVGAVAHVAYHLGAIRQKVAGLRAH